MNANENGNEKDKGTVSQKDPSFGTELLAANAGRLPAHTLFWLARQCQPMVKAGTMPATPIPTVGKRNFQ
jgi:hypothetical protein